jgi:ubiquinone/menaquinone biosynthesis C-methylase UbiE
MKNNKMEIGSKQLEVLSYMYSKHLVSVDYINIILNQKGKTISEISNATELYELDQDHFLGIEANNECIKSLNICADDLILDIGSGLGGPARYIAEITKAKVVGVEIQRDRLNFSNQFTNNVGLGNKIKFILGDFNEVEFKMKSYSKVISFLSILHIIDKIKALKRISEVLTQNGMLYIEDYHSSHTLSENENKKILNTISCPNLLSKDDYLLELEKNGVMIESVIDMSEEWSSKAHIRFQTMSSDLENNKIIYGSNRALGALGFAMGVSELFSKNTIKGFRIVGKKI